MNTVLRIFSARPKGRGGGLWCRPVLLARLVSVLGVVILAACGGATEEKYVERPVEKLYNQATDAIEARKYADAANLFDEVERQHPYSSWATRAQLMAAYSYYQENAYDDSIIALDRFIQLHPANKQVPYAYYLKGLCYYEQISDVTRDQKMTERALKTFNQLVTRYPNSKYTRAAKVKIDLTYDHLAGKEMNIGRYYLRQGHYLAAINRFKAVIENYQTTTHVPEALHRLTEAYRALGIEDEAQKTAAVLGHNFPSSEWYVDSYDLMKGKREKAEKEKDKEPWYKFW